MPKHKKKPPERIKEVNASGKAQLRIRDIRMLESYGLTPVSKQGEYLYELRDRVGNTVAGESFRFGTEEISEYVQRLKIERPLHLPAAAQGLYYPELFERCQALYDDAKRRGKSTAARDLWPLFRRKYLLDNEMHYAEFREFIGSGLCYARHVPSMQQIIGWMLSVIRKRDAYVQPEQTA